jgi:hypothetical protein
VTVIFSRQIGHGTANSTRRKREGRDMLKPATNYFVIVRMTVEESK